MVDSRWAHFEYTSGSNPYIAKTEEEKDRIIRKYKRKGIAVDKLVHPSFDTDFYVIHDKEGAEK